MRAHQRPKLLHNALQQTQPVVLRQRVQEVLEDAVLVSGSATGNPLELGHDLLLIRGGQGRRVQDGSQLGVLLENGAQLRQGLGDVVEVGSFGGRSVLISSFSPNSISIASFRRKHTRALAYVPSTPYSGTGGRTSCAAEEAYVRIPTRVEARRPTRATREANMVQAIRNPKPETLGETMWFDPMAGRDAIGEKHSCCWDVTEVDVWRTLLARQTPSVMGHVIRARSAPVVVPIPGLFLVGTWHNPNPTRR